MYDTMAISRIDLYTFSCYYLLCFLILSCIIVSLSSIWYHLSSQPPSFPFSPRSPPFLSHPKGWGVTLPHMLSVIMCYTRCVEGMVGPNPRGLLCHRPSFSESSHFPIYWYIMKTRIYILYISYFTGPRLTPVPMVDPGDVSPHLTSPLVRYVCHVIPGER